MMDLNDVKAGKYQLVAPRWDQILSKPDEPLDYIRHTRGAIVDLDVAEARRLVSAGAVVKPGQLEREAAEAARALAERATAEYNAILAGLPDDVRAEVAPDTVSKTPDSTPPAGSATPAPVGGWWGEGAEPKTIPEVLAAVGDDQEKLAGALRAEEAAATPRTTLVDQLKAKVDAGQGGGQGGSS